MVKQIQFKFIFPAIGERHNNEWRITANYAVEQVLEYDYEGGYPEQEGVQEFETLTITSAEDWTLGFNSGTILLKDIPAELRRDIVQTGLRAAKATYAERKGIGPSAWSHCKSMAAV